MALYDRLPVDENDPGEFRSHANLALVEFKIRSGSYAGTLLLNSSSGGFPDIRSTPVAEQFIIKKDAPISIRLPAAITMS